MPISLGQKKLDSPGDRRPGRWCSPGHLLAFARGSLCYFCRSLSGRRISRLSLRGTDGPKGVAHRDISWPPRGGRFVTFGDLFRAEKSRDSAGQTAPQVHISATSLSILEGVALLLLPFYFVPKNLAIPLPRRSHTSISLSPVAAFSIRLLFFRCRSLSLPTNIR